MPSAWLLLAYGSGDVMLLSLPDCRPALTLRGLAHGWTVLGHETPATSVE